MYALKAHNSKPILEKSLSTTFSISNKTFPKIDLLMCARILCQKHL